MLSVNFTAWLGQTAAVSAERCCLRPTADRAMGAVLGLLVPPGEDRQAASSRVAAGGDSDGRVCHVAAATVWTEVPVHYASFSSSNAGGQAWPGSAAVPGGLPRLHHSEDRRLDGRQLRFCWFLSRTISSELRQIHVPTTLFCLRIRNLAGDLIATVASLLIITVMLLRRFIQAQVLKEQWKMEIQQAQEVQQLLIPARVA